MTWRRPPHRHDSSFWRFDPERAEWVGKCRLCHQPLVATPEQAADLEASVSEHCLETKPTIRIAVAGGRDYIPTPVEMDAFWRIWRSLVPEDHPAELLHGDCRGVDRYVANQARQRRIKVRAYIADWDRHGKAAGPLRNRQMLANAHALVVFLRQSGRGTLNCLHTAEDLSLSIHKIGA